MTQRFGDWKRPEIVHGQPTKWGWVVWHPDKLVLGAYTDIGFATYLNAYAGIEIGERAELGSHCSVNSLSTVDDKEGKIVIGKDVKIGAHTVIMPGVTIGENTTIGACSFVNRNIPPNCVAFGVPVRVMKQK